MYSDPEMFFEIWKNDFIMKMEEERKKRREEQKRKKEQRKKTQASSERKVKEREIIIPTWVREVFSSHYFRMTNKMSTFCRCVISFLRFYIEKNCNATSGT